MIGQDAAKQGHLARAAAGQLRRAPRALQPFLVESRLNILGVAIVALVLLLALVGPLIAPENPNQINLLAVLQPPSVHHWFGTDNLGRDLFSRVLVGTRISVEVAVIILSLSVLFGTALGIVSGLAGGLADEIVMRVTDLFLAFPGFILAAAIAATLGPSLQHTVLALAVVFWPWYTRLIRGQVLSLREREFVLAARVARAGTLWIATRHLARNVLAILVVQVSLDVGYAILATSSLSFLGLGAQPPSPEWGAIIAEGRSYIQTAWWWSTFAGIALAVTVLGFNLLGDGLRDWIDPRLRGSIGGLQE
ncbi:MAG TPA: ABC transporter permease [Candidatus Eisenbacteria bacterium]|nr:ABC transporter permease [Candidatus Eisenbacteria bacterium]